MVEGKVVDRFERRVQRTIKGSKIVCNGTKADPGYLIEQRGRDEDAETEVRTPGAERHHRHPGSSQG